jgi:hypothetical protein
MSIRGAGALHTWTSADGQEFVIGDKTRNPHVWIRKLNGRHSKPEMDDNRDVKIGATGEIPRLSALRGKTEAWEVVIDAESLVEERNAHAQAVGPALLRELLARGGVVSAHPRQRPLTPGHPSHHHLGSVVSARHGHLGRRRSTG